jgi:cytochrome c peroxidase
MFTHRSKSFLAGLIVILFCTGISKWENTTPYEFPELKFFPPMPEDPDNPVTIEGVALGRYLFYDPVLSIDSTLSCGSCHKQQFAFSDAPKQFSSGVGKEKLKRNTPPLFNLAWYPAFFWDGKATSLEDQILHSVRSAKEMNLSWQEAEKRINRNGFYRHLFYQVFGVGRVDSMHIAKAIAQFQRTLLSSNSKYDRVIRGEDHFTALEYEGFNLMNDQTKGDCLHCHTTDGDALGTTARFSNNGLDNIYETTEYSDPGLGGVTGQPGDAGKFKIPSLRNIVLTPPYMHDGRFKTLEEVLDFYSEGVHPSVNVDPKMGAASNGGVALNDHEKKAILAMLQTLTDSVLMTHPAFSNPYTD